MACSVLRWAVMIWPACVADCVSVCSLGSSRLLRLSMGPSEKGGEAKVAGVQALGSTPSPGWETIVDGVQAKVSTPTPCM